MVEIDWRTWLLAFLLIAGAGLALALALLAWVLWRVRRIKLPEGAGFLTALRATPLIVRNGGDGYLSPIIFEAAGGAVTISETQNFVEIINIENVD